jgi:Fe2+ transport system protein FeoA
MSPMRLIDLVQGEEAFLAGFSEEDDLSMRLRDLGMNDGVLLRVIKYAPLGDPIQIRLRGFDLSIQKSMAKKILVQKKVSKEVETGRL